jgi:hypothetical protein
MKSRGCEGRGSNPCPEPRGVRLQTRRSVTLPFKQFSQALHFSTTTVSGVVCVLCQLGHKRKERRRLADEEPHVR